MKLYFYIPFIFYAFLTHAQVEGFIQEIFDLHRETKGCVGSTHTSFRSFEDLLDCNPNHADELKQLSVIDKDLTTLSKQTYLIEQLDKYKNHLSKEYKKILPLNQVLNFNQKGNDLLEKTIEDIKLNINLLQSIDNQISDENKLLADLKCQDPRVGNWKERNEICQKIKMNKSEIALKEIKSNILTQYPYLSHQEIKKLIQKKDKLSHEELNLSLKKAIQNHSQEIADEIKLITELRNNPQKIKSFATPVPGPESHLSSDEWAFLQRIINGGGSINKGFEKFIYSECLFNQDFINHEKLVGVDLFEKNIALTILSLGSGAALARYGTIGKVIGTVGPTLAGLGLVDLNEIKHQKARCESLKKELNLRSLSENEQKEKNLEIKNCETSLRISFALSLMAPAADVISLSTPALRSLKISSPTDKVSSRITHLKEQEQIISHTRPTTNKPPKALMTSLSEFSIKVNEGLSSASRLANAYQISLSDAEKILLLRKESSDQTFKKLLSSEYETEDLTQRGYEQFKSLEDFKSKNQFGSNDQLTTTGQMNRVKTYFTKIKNGPEIYEAMFKAMSSRASMIEWYNDFYDDLLYRLLSSKNPDLIESFKKTKKIPRSIVEEAMLERAALYGWPKTFTELSGGVLSGREFGKKIAMGNYLREQDLDQVATKAAQDGIITDQKVSSKILSGELKHGELTHAAHMDYMLYLAEKGKLGPIKPQEVRGFIKRMGEALQYNEPGLQEAWSTLFDGTAQGKTLATPNNFHEIFSQYIDL